MLKLEFVAVIVEVGEGGVLVAPSIELGRSFEVEVVSDRFAI